MYTRGLKKITLLTKKNLRNFQIIKTRRLLPHYKYKKLLVEEGKNHI